MDLERRRSSLTIDDIHQHITVVPKSDFGGRTFFSETKRATLGLAPGETPQDVTPSSRSLSTTPAAKLLGLYTCTSLVTMRTAFDSSSVYCSALTRQTARVSQRPAYPSLR